MPWNESEGPYRAGARRVGTVLLLMLGAGCTLVLGINGDFHQGTGGGTTSTGGSPTASSSSGSTGGNPTTSSSSSGTGGNPQCGPITAKGFRNQVGLTTVLKTEPIDYSITANVPQVVVEKSPGQFSTPYPATGKNDGTFEIDNVPCGPYFLDFGIVGYWLTNRTGLDFSTYQVNDLDAQPITNDPQVHLVVNNMTPWVDNDVFELIDPNSAVYVFDQAYGVLTPDWMAGDTSKDATGDWLAWVFNVKSPVVASSKISVFHGGVQAGHTYTTIQDYAEVSFATPTDMDAGMPTFDLVVNFTQVMHTSGSFPLNLDATKFEALAKDFNPRATPINTTVDFQAHPALLDHGQLMGTADLAFENVNAPAGVIKKSYAYGNPFKNWSIFFTVASSHSLTYQLPGANPVDIKDNGGFPLFRCDMAADDPKLSGTTPYAPETQPVQHPKIDGMSFFNGGQGMTALGSLTPTISWDAPSPPNQYQHYEIRLAPVQVINGTTRIRNALRTYLYADGSATSVVVPPGYLQPSSTYVVGIVAVSHTNVVYEKAPNGTASPICVAGTLSDFFQTPAQ